MPVFMLPDLGEGLREAEIHEWHVKEGDDVAVDQLLVSVETAKAVVEVPSPYHGKIVKLFGKAGDVIAVDSPLVEFSGVAIKDTGTVAGTIEVGNTILKESASTLGGKSGAGNVKATPAVRALAQRLGVDLSGVKASGPGGVVTSDDVKRASEALLSMGELESFKGVRRSMALAMKQSKDEIVPVTVMEEANIAGWADNQDTSVRLIRALIKGVAAEPCLNAWYDSKAIGRRVSGPIHIGLAVDTAEGLFVPVIKDAASLSEAALRAKVNEYKKTVADRTIAAENLRDATITLSNFGRFGGKFASPIIMPPQVAIIAAGSTRAAPVVKNNEIKIGKILPISLTFDHRAITGGEATRFLSAMVQDLELEQ